MPGMRGGKGPPPTKRAVNERLARAVRRFLALRTAQGLVPAEDAVITELIAAYEEWEQVVPLVVPSED